MTPLSLEQRIEDLERYHDDLEHKVRQLEELLERMQADLIYVEGMVR